MTPIPARRRTILEVDDRGRLSLAKLGFRSMQVVAETTGDGGLIIHPAVAMTPAEAAHYRDPDAVRRLEEALTAASEGKLHTFELRSEADDK